MSSASISHQISRCLDQVFLNKDKIDEMKQQRGVKSLKKALRPGGDPTKPLPYILSFETYRCNISINRGSRVKVSRTTNPN